MKRLFKSTEDYTKPLVQIEILQIDDKLYQRNWTKIMVQGKARKAKRGWKLMDIKPSQLKAAGHRNGKLYKITYDGRFLYAAPVTQHVGPKDE